jgi:predicted PurR-regulated permease PerM
MPSSEPSRYRALLSIAAAVVIIAGLRQAAEFCMPVLLGIMVAAVSSPVTTWMLRKGAPPLMAAAAVLVLDVAVLGSLGSLFFLAAADLQERLPMYIQRYQRLSVLTDRFMHRHGLDGIDATVLHLNEVLSDVAGQAAGMMSLTVFVLLVAFLALCELTIMGDKLRSMSSNAPELFDRVDRIVREVQLYLGVKFWTSLTAGFASFILLKLFGVGPALLVSLTLLVFRFVPNVGSAAATIFAVAITLAEQGVGAAIGVGLGFLVINVLIGNIMEPRMLGRTIGMSPFVVLLGMLFWAWMWGPIGALLSVPILTVFKFICEHTKDLNWISKLMDASAGPMPTEEPGDGTNPMLRRPSVVIGLGGTRDSATPPQPRVKSSGQV